MSNSISPHIVAQIHASGRRCVLAITGGGSGAIGALLEVPGASATVLEAIVPYAPTALASWLGGVPDRYCSERTARAMAMAAFERARVLCTNDAHSLRGIGATASLVSNRPKKGAHRIHAAWQSAEVTQVATYELEKGAGTRADEEQIAENFILDAVVEACDVAAPALVDRGKVTRRRQHAPADWTELLLGRRSWVAAGKSQCVAGGSARVVFPGAFNPLHAGHLRMAELASERLGEPVTFELSIANVDKPPLDFIEIAERLTQFEDRDVLLTRSATFVDKSRISPNCVFVVGADTMDRIADPKYYGGDATQRDAAIRSIAEQGCRFLVFGRNLTGRFTVLSDLRLPPALRALCDEVPSSKFQVDISSTDLRQ